MYCISSPHRPAPQIRVVKKKDAKGPTTNETQLDLNPPEKKRDSAKQEKYEGLQDKAATAGSLDELATILRETVATMRLYSSSAPTKACFKLLDEIQERLTNHHEFPSMDDTSESFSSIVTRSVVSPVKLLTTQVESQHKAIQSLAKTVETLKNAPLLMTPSTPTSPSASYAKAASSTPNPKPKPPPLPNPSDERILVRFDGPLPPSLLLPYRQILDELNACLAPRGLPILAYSQKYLDCGIFLVPSTGKEGVAALAERWNEWGPSILPGGRIVPVATHTMLQVDGVPFSGAGSLDDLKREFEERNPSLGKVVGTPRWVNKPPSEARVAALAAAGRSPPKAGSLFIQLESRELVDRAVASGRVVLAGTAPAVGRGFPHLRVVQCWGCFRYGHTRARCSVAETKCGGCGNASHGIVCAEKPSCINCSGAHRSDSFSCPARKRIAEHLRQRAADLCATLDAQSRFNPHLRWWTPVLTELLADVKRKEQWFHRHLAPLTQRIWLDARRTLYQAIAEAKDKAWRTFVGDLARVNVYDVLDRVRRRHRSVFPSLVDPETGNVEVGHLARGRLGGGGGGERIRRR
ncbi:hypothetical protein B0H13DRAFT_1917136 [Mycena leptocephala]|nr:hypothetical protein B0H13DRAFT_1917136 [Mycena leptocephala]